MYLGEKIKAFGDKKFNGNVTHYAQATGKSRTDLYRYFQEKTIPGADFIEKLYELGCDINWLLGPAPVYAEINISEPQTVYGRNLREENEHLRNLLAQFIEELSLEEEKIRNLRISLAQAKEDLNPGLDMMELEI